MTTPIRTAEQRGAALEAAMASRHERARLRDALKTRQMAAVDVLRGAEENPLWANLKVVWFLASLPGVGEVRSERIMRDLHIAPSRRIRGLGVRQRVALIAELDGL